MKTIEDWALQLDRMYAADHPGAEDIIRSIMRDVYADILHIAEEMDDSLASALEDRMHEVLGELD